MKPSDLAGYLEFCINNNFPALIVGRPGIGKTDIVKNAATSAGAFLIHSHPVVSDPTDYKGLPFPKDNGTAQFLPYGELSEIIKTKKKTIYFIDDLGQASPGVQAACMQLILGRRINGHLISDWVTFIAATNRREDMAAVTGILEPVKSRFSIVKLDVDIDDWIQWALSNNMPVELIAFIRFRPDLLNGFAPSRDITNSVSPRTIATVGKQQAAGLPPKYEFEAFAGIAGEAFAIEYKGFLQLFRQIPSLEDILKHPNTAPIPKDPGVIYALTIALAHQATDHTIAAICDYITRLPDEHAVACMKYATTKNAGIANNRAYIKWAAKNAALLV
ncbi:ATP-binding protein [Chitinophaga varians]|uniref:ATP-binding protein n=1 Tax=Chitinophaga varians TaxID=2202339 RepID=UPI00165EC1EA|nr:ATP-binding protein [Chitinophaga varians]MBC9909103.1 ATP-binding protein [Chitinophaga varians]